MNKPKRTHTTFHTGSKIRIIFLNGKVLIAKYKETRKGKSVLTYDHGEIKLADVRTMNYYKPLPHELKAGK